MGYFSNIYKAELPHRAKTVYMYLKDRSNAQGQCYPAIGTIAKELHLSRRTVERAIQDLITAGFLKKEQRWRENTKGKVCPLGGIWIMSLRRMQKGSPEEIRTGRESDIESYHMMFVAKAYTGFYVTVSLFF